MRMRPSAATSPIGDDTTAEIADVVVVRGQGGPLAASIERLLTEQGYVTVSEPDPRAAVVVEAAVADYDLIASMEVGPAVEVAAALDLAEECGAQHFVLLSSAMVYGALPNNPIPLTEDAVLRPADDFVYARALAAAEELVDRWRQSGPQRAVSVLRPAVLVSERHSSSLARALTAGLGQGFGRTDSSAQFVHIDDVASAAVLAVTERLDGVYNVAPDSWIPGDRLRALAGNRLRLPLPERVAEVVSSLLWRFQRGPIPPGLQPYIRQSWVVANDKLRAEGWRPSVTNEEAFVEGTEAPWWSMITPKRRQELSLGALAAATVAVLAAIGTAIVRWRRR